MFILTLEAELGLLSLSDKFGTFCLLRGAFQVETASISWHMCFMRKVESQA